MEEVNFIGGFLLGLASALHCAAMCGGIAGSLLMALTPGREKSRPLLPLLGLQAGRVLAYVLAGGIVGALGSTFYGMFDQREAYRVMQWAAAVTLGWIGFSLTGLAPPLSIFDRLLAPIGKGLEMLRRHGMVAGPLAGILWGFLPCGMVYAALFYAMLAGSAPQGMLVMAGFGLGTLPAVTLAAIGYGRIVAWARRPTLRRAMGALLILLAPLSLLVPASLIEAICRVV
jgi:sulfite exporter TauE/SafE